MSSKKPSSPDAKLADNKSPKGDAIVQDPKAKPGNPKQAAPSDKPAGKNEKPEKGGKADRSPEPVDKNAKGAKDNRPAPGKGKPSDNAGIFLTEGKHNEPAPKPENVLVSSGLLEAYDYLQRQICKHGLPKGNAFEFAAITFLKYERKLKAKEADKRVEVTNKQIEKKPDVREIEPRQGRSPRGHHDDNAKNASTVKSPDAMGKEDPKNKGKGAQSPPPEEKGGKGKDGKKPQSPPPKEEKGGKDKERSKSPPGKDMKKDDVIIDKNPKKGDKEPVAPAKKK